MNVRVILALTVPMVLGITLIGAILHDGFPDEGALDIADELIGVVGVVLGGIVSGLLVAGEHDHKDDNKKDGDDEQ